MCSTIHNYIKQTPFDAPFFKKIMYVPVLGQIVQIWKRQVLYAELNEMSKDPNNAKGKVTTGGFIEITPALPLAQKTVDIINLNVDSFYNGRFADMAIGVAGLALTFFPAFATFGFGLFVCAFTSLTIRVLAAHGVFDSSIENKYNPIPS